jgi:hypothetical protein
MLLLRASVSLLFDAQTGDSNKNQFISRTT